METGTSLQFKRRHQRSNLRKRPRGFAESPVNDDSGNSKHLHAGSEYGSRGIARPKTSDDKIVAKERSEHSHMLDTVAAGGHFYDMSDDADADAKKHEALATASRPQIDAADVNSSQKCSSARDARKPFGPIRAPSHIRSSIRVDYQPDICKDFKETGYCGFGDACKFLHDRGDYKAGWQLDRDWHEEQKLRRLNPDSGSTELLVVRPEEDLDSDGFPFACFICRGKFTSPVVTLCSHYFCEPCILQHLESASTCPICMKQLRGILNSASKLIAKLGGTSA